MKIKLKKENKRLYRLYYIVLKCNQDLKNEKCMFLKILYVQGNKTYVFSLDVVMYFPF